MTGLELVLLILAVVAALAAAYVGAWWFCNGVTLQKREGHYILDDADMNDERFYPGLDMVDESKNSYIKNEVELDSISEHKEDSAPSAPNHDLIETPTKTASAEDEPDSPYSPEPEEDEPKDMPLV